ncbi:MAG: hypothetical protein BJ554DRAFT_928 [Olpidium bornovanus]|uniref:Uncharacterized protein n=1 Tax=Olpidium bornovanus TaxID=278681 RepID=A0A8H7ZSY0_9FUNG|nr:MAG: hypothetical protein BJ554DRAFT_928 [Olpidium bornovanus]
MGGGNCQKTYSATPRRLGQEKNQSCTLKQLKDVTSAARPSLSNAKSTCVRIQAKQISGSRNPNEDILPNHGYYATDIRRAARKRGGN